MGLCRLKSLWVRRRFRFFCFNRWLGSLTAGIVSHSQLFLSSVSLTVSCSISLLRAFKHLAILSIIERCYHRIDSLKCSKMCFKRHGNKQLGPKQANLLVMMFLLLPDVFWIKLPFIRLSLDSNSDLFIATRTSITRLRCRKNHVYLWLRLETRREEAKNGIASWILIERFASFNCTIFSVNHLR